MVIILQNKSQNKFDTVSRLTSISDHKTWAKRFKLTSTQIDVNHDASSAHLKSKATLETNVTEDVNIDTEESSRHCAFTVRSNSDQ